MHGERGSHVDPDRTEEAAENVVRGTLLATSEGQGLKCMRENQSRDRKSQTKGPRLKPLPKCYAAFQWPKGHCSFRVNVKRTCDWSSHE